MDVENNQTDLERLAHHGIKGQKWGVRRFQNEDGSYTSAGKKRYGMDDDSPDTGKKEKKSNLKRNIAIGAAAVATVAAAYGAYRYGKFIKDKNVELAVERGKKVAERLKARDTLTAKKFPDLFEVSPDIHYERYVQEAASKAKSQKLTEAYRNVKRAANVGREAVKSSTELEQSFKNLANAGFSSSVLEEVKAVLSEMEKS